MYVGIDNKKTMTAQNYYNSEKPNKILDNNKNNNNNNNNNNN